MEPVLATKTNKRITSLALLPLGNIHPKQQLINLLENREKVEYNVYEDENFHTAEILWAPQFALESLFEDLKNLPKDAEVMYHISPRTFRFEIFVNNTITNFSEL